VRKIAVIVAIVIISGCARNTRKLSHTCGDCGPCGYAGTVPESSSSCWGCWKRKGHRKCREIVEAPYAPETIAPLQLPQ
jgi:hypothetical protein